MEREREAARERVWRRFVQVATLGTNGTDGPIPRFRRVVLAQPLHSPVPGFQLALSAVFVLSSPLAIVLSHFKSILCKPGPPILHYTVLLSDLGSDIPNN